MERLDFYAPSVAFETTRNVFEPQSFVLEATRDAFVAGRDVFRPACVASATKRIDARAEQNAFATGRIDAGLKSFDAGHIFFGQPLSKRWTNSLATDLPRQARARRVDTDGLILISRIELSRSDAGN
jgi:hypothetical protein